MNKSLNKSLKLLFKFQLVIAALHTFLVLSMNATLFYSSG